MADWVDLGPALRRATAAYFSASFHAANGDRTSSGEAAARRAAGREVARSTGRFHHLPLDLSRPPFRARCRGCREAVARASLRPDAGLVACDGCRASFDRPQPELPVGAEALRREVVLLRGALRLFRRSEARLARAGRRDEARRRALSAVLADRRLRRCEAALAELSARDAERERAASRARAVAEVAP